MATTKTKKRIAGVLGGLATLGGGSVVADQVINPYETVGTKLEISSVSSLEEGGQQKIVAEKTEPKVTLEKWNGEVALGIKSLDIPPNTEGSRPFLSKNVEWQSGDIKMEAVPLDAGEGHEDGGMEINIILNSKPSSNVFTFQLKNYENLDFFYQSPLTDEEVKEGTNRPENVVGSYAVYYKDHTNHRVGDTNYATGKAYHIYRPLVTDNGGSTVWAELSYDSGVLTVTVPQDFLDKATYPVKVDPTFGLTTQGASNETVSSGSANDNTSASMFTMTENGTVTAFTVWNHFTTSGGNWVGRIYSGSANSIGSVVTGGGPCSATNMISTYRANACTASIPTASLIGGTTYWLQEDPPADGPGSSNQLAFDTGGEANTGTHCGDVIVSCVYDTSIRSIYATYTASASGSSPTGRMIQNGGVIIINNPVIEY